MSADKPAESIAAPPWMAILHNCAQLLGSRGKQHRVPLLVAQVHSVSNSSPSGVSSTGVTRVRDLGLPYPHLPRRRRSLASDCRV
jgi:hypothetical protein